MAVVAGVDFGTLSVRVSIVDQRAAGGSPRPLAEYPLVRKKEDPGPRHAVATRDHMKALVEATRKAVAQAGVAGTAMQAIALDTTGSSVIPVDAGLASARRLLPLVRSSREGGSRRDHRYRRAARSSKRSTGAAASTPPSGASRSCCTGCATIREKRAAYGDRARALRHGGGRALRHHRSGAGCRAASAPWATSGCGTPRSAGCPPRSFSPRSIRCSAACARNSAAATPPRTRSPDTSRRNGPRSSDCAPGIPDSRRRVRRALGRHRRGHPRGRRRQRGRHLHLHHGDREGDRT